MTMPIDDLSDSWVTSRTSYPPIRTALRTGDEGSAGITGLMVAALRFQQTRFHDASRSLDEAQRHLERHDAFGLRILLLVLRVGVALHTGDEDGAVRWLARCHEVPVLRTVHKNQKVDVPAVTPMRASPACASVMPSRAASRTMSDMATA